MIYNNTDSLDPDSVVTLPLNQLATALPQLCFSNNINNLHIFGPEEYCTGLAEQIKVNHFSNKELNIEVN